MKKIIVLLGIVGICFTSCKKNELTGTEIIMCQDNLDKEMKQLNDFLKYKIISLTEYDKRVEKAKQAYKDCIISSEGN